MKSNITLTALILSSTVDLNKDNKVIYPNIIFKNKIYSNDQFITFNTISAGIQNTEFYDTQRYITLDELSSIFRFSQNIDKSKVSVQVGNYSINDNKILLDSKVNLSLPISAYYNQNSKKYFINSSNCTINTYNYECEFNTNLIQFLIPMSNQFSYQLKDYQSILNNTFPQQSVTGYLEIRDINQSNFDNFNSLNIFKGKVNNKSQIISNNVSGFSGSVYSKYYKKELNKFYDVNSVNYNCFYVDSELKSNYLWLTQQEIQELYFKTRKQLNIDYDLFDDYGIENISTPIFHLGNIIKYYYFDTKYNQQREYKNASKLDLNIIVKSDKVNILQDNISVYSYNEPIFQQNKKVYYIKNENEEILSSAFITSFEPFPGTYISINIDGQDKNSIKKLKSEKEHTVSYFVESIQDGNKHCICSSIVNTIPLDISFYSNTSFLQANLEENICSSYLISETSSLILKDQKYLNEFTSTQVITKNESKYKIELSSSFDKNYELDTKKFNLNYDLYFHNQEENKDYLLSSIQFPIVRYGNFENTCLNEYNVLTNNNSLTFDSIINLPKENIIDINSFKELEFSSEWTLIDNQITLSWLKFNQKQNKLVNSLSTKFQLQSYIDDIRNGKIQYIIFKNINTLEEIKYYIYPKSLLRFPGQKNIDIKINGMNYSINSIENFNLISYPFNEQKFILNSNNQEIVFNNYKLNLPQQKEHIISGKFNTLPKKIDFLSFDENYILSGKYFNSISGSLSLKDIQYGSLSSQIIIYPNTMKYSYNTIDLINGYTLTFNVIPNNYEILDNEYDFVYYGKNLMKYYSKVEILNKNKVIIYLDKAFSDISNLNSNNEVILEGQNVKDQFITIPSKEGFINYFLEIKVK